MIDHATVTASVHARWPLLEIARAHHSNRRAESISFADKPYLISLYAELPTMEDASFVKAPQTGLSELLIQHILWSAGWRDRICAYVLPTYVVRDRFVSERIDPLLLRTPAYAARLPGGELGLAEGSENLKRKRFGPRGSLLFLGSNTPNDFLEFSADVAIVDEWDVCVEEHVAGIHDRVSESSYPQVIRVSNARREKGIETYFAAGSQEQWFQRCTRCGHRQAIGWESHIVHVDALGLWRPRDTEREADRDLGDLRPVCERCHRPWERVAEGGAWVAEYPRRPERSFRITRLDVLSSHADRQPIRSAFVEFIKAQGNPTLLSLFWMGKLGRLYRSAGSRVSDEDLDRASTEPPLDPNGGRDYDQPAVVMGVDVGAILHVTISVLGTRPGKGEDDEQYVRRGRYVCTVPSFDEVIRLIDLFRVDACVIDAAPETHEAKRVRDHYRNGAGEDRCSVWLARFHATPRVGADELAVRLDYEEHVITADRTQLLDVTYAEIRDGRRTLPSDVDTVLHWRDQMRAPVRKIEGERAVWDEGTAADHFRFADAYERLALELWTRSGGAG